MTAVIQMRPKGQFTNQDLQLLLDEIRAFVEAPEVMRTDAAAKFVGISYSKFRRMGFPSHKLPNISGRFYLKSELLAYVQRH